MTGWCRRRSHHRDLRDIDHQGWYIRFIGRGLPRTPQPPADASPRVDANALLCFIRLRRIKLTARRPHSQRDQRAATSGYELRRRDLEDVYSDARSGHVKMDMGSVERIVKGRGVSIESPMSQKQPRMIFNRRLAKSVDIWRSLGGRRLRRRCLGHCTWTCPSYWSTQSTTARNINVTKATQRESASKGNDRLANDSVFARSFE